jgi:site-specific DNA-methyltransferase (adenine-specific)
MIILATFGILSLNYQEYSHFFKWEMNWGLTKYKYKIIGGYMYQINNILNTIIQGNTLEVLKNIPDNSINMVITSPPYWGLRCYNTNPQVWDGDENCKHEWNTEIIRKRTNGDVPGKNSLIAKHRPNDIVNRPDVVSNICIKCGAWKGELGNEPTYEMYINHLIQIFDEVRRVLKDDGTCWINLGDSYAGSNHCGIKPKSLVGIPDRFKIAMVDNGWICRNDIIWHKPNAMPESVKDRFTDNYERLFFFTKNRKYYFEQQLEEYQSKPQKPINKNQQNCNNGYTTDRFSAGYRDYYSQGGRNKRSVWSINTKPFKEAHFAIFPEELIETPIKAGCPENGIVMDIFMGSGTTAVVAQKLNRNYIGIELNSEYIKIAKNRINNIKISNY